MLRVNLNDPMLVENLKAFRELKATGFYADEQLQKMYDEQVDLDKKRSDNNAE